MTIESMMLVVFLCLFLVGVNGLDNGLALTPPMGWSHWTWFRCNIDCENNPHNCLSENLIKAQADRLSEDGWLEAGYEYVVIDDCWMSMNRTSHGRLQGDLARFPHGMKALADYVHSKGLKLGIYTAMGPRTCAGFPASRYYLQLDIQTFADWGIDYIKMDSCTQGKFIEFPPIGLYLNMTGRPILMNCAMHRGRSLGYDIVRKNCNVARTGADVQNSWDFVTPIIEQVAANDGNFVSEAGPGYYNDPDMLILGVGVLSHDQERVQMGMYSCIFAAPLFMGNDLRNINKPSRDLLQHPRLIAINQDAMGKQGTRLHKSGDIQAWTRPLADGSTVFAFLNLGQKNPTKVSFSMADLGLSSKSGYNVTEVFDGIHEGKFTVKDKFSKSVNPTGIYLAIASPL